LSDNTSESDEDDNRSIHFAVIENNSKVVATMRLIIKDSMNNSILPIEKYFPASTDYLDQGGVNAEISRYICSHNDKRMQYQLTWPLISAVALYLHQRNISCAFGMIEPSLYRLLVNRGLNIHKYSKPIYIDFYNDSLIPVSFCTKSNIEFLFSTFPDNFISMIDADNLNFVFDCESW
jgi:N-acyl-L-homoserine lactone synthetase